MPAEVYYLPDIFASAPEKFILDFFTAKE